MMGHWIIVPVVMPAVLAGVIVLAARHDLVMQRAVALAGTLCFVAVAIWLALHSDQPEAYRLGNWPAPFGIVLVSDRLSALMLVLLGGVALPVLLYIIGTGWDTRGAHFHALFLFQLMGLAGAFLTADAFNLFVFFEVLLIASYGLMIHGGGADRLRAGLQYVAFNLIGSTLFLFSLATLYAVMGTLNMADLAVKLPHLPSGDQALVRVAAVLLLIVFAVKGALVPLQFWLPGTYANAPGPVAALFAVMTKVGAYAAIRLGTLVFGAEPTAGLWSTLLFPAGLASIILGAVGVLGARSLARQAAFAAIGSMGVAFTVIAAFTPMATAAALYYMIHSTLAGAVLFLVADLVIDRRGTDRLNFPHPPLAQGGLIAGLFMIAAIAVSGMPPLSGFLGKLLVMQALVDHAALVWGVILVASFLTVIGMARSGSVLFWKAHASGAEAEPHADEPLSFIAAGLLVGALVTVTITAGPLTQWLQTTAQELHNPLAYIRANELAQGE